MSNNESDSICCSSSNVSGNADNVDDSSTSFPIENWNSETDGEAEQPNENAEIFNRDNLTEYVSYMDNTIILEFPKFSKGFKRSDFDDFVWKYVGEENLERLENFNYPNVWLMVLKDKEVRENCLRIWKTKIKNKTCYIKPYHDYELRGCLHWLPHFIPDDDVKRQLNQFGEVLVLENQVHDYWYGGIKSEVKYFGLRLKDGMVKNDMPHFLKFGGYRTLVIVRGRKPACFHCREFGHAKKDCKKYQEKLGEYCKNLKAKKPRTKERGKRHKPETDNKNHQSESKSTSREIFAQKDSEVVEPALKRTYSDRKLTDEKKAEILGILLSLKEWKREITEMVEQTLKKIEENSRMSLTPTELAVSEAKEESIDSALTIILKLLNEMKQTAFEMIEVTLDNLKNIVTCHFGLNSNEPLEKLISNLRIRKKEKLEPIEVKLIEDQLLSYSDRR